MSDPKLISPLLDGFVMGEPISEHNGVRCCPAMHQESADKYIVKIISIPASSVQLDALLLSGAFSDRDSALSYYKDLASQTLQEAELLQRLSKSEGYISYEAWQIEPMEDGNGYEVYLLGAYRPTLAGQLRSAPPTQLGAVNLGLDLCAALSVCRRNGYLYVDLKPENVFLNMHHEYRIGDLGFLPLDSLKYQSLPDKYRSAYTAPEITDAYSYLNSTLDIYAAGMILYQVYNNGQLPPAGEPFIPPAYADYEMAEIIQKACAEDPASRWEDPMQMGQALASYLQRNSVNDVPIIPVPSPDPKAAMPEAEEAFPSAEEILTEESVEDSIDEEIAEAESAEEILPEEELPEAPLEEDVAEDFSEDDDDGQFIIDGFLIDDTTPSEEDAAEFADAAVSSEVIEMLAHADELIAHPAPEPAVAPDPIEVPLPAPQAPEADAQEEMDVASEAESEDPAQQPELAPEEEDESIPEETEEISETPENPPSVPDQQEEEVFPKDKPRRKHTGLIVALVTTLLLLAICAGAFYFYDNYYLQTVSGIVLNGEGTDLTVSLDTQIDNTLLNVVCTDTYGNTHTAPVLGNKAVFTALNPGTSYRVTVQISGFHRLTGSTAATYTTAPQTNIISFSAIAGDSDGSVILNFAVQGPDNTTWTVVYSSPGIEEKTAVCAGHMANITDLQIGSTYTFRLVPTAELYVVGNDTLEFTATKVIYAENLTLEGFYSGKLSVRWDTPEDVQVDSWTVRCYNNSFDTTIIVDTPQAEFPGLDPAAGYTVDVKAAGMSVGKQVSVSANSVTFKEILLDSSTPGQLIVTWNFEGTAPADGWRLLYTMDGSQKQVITSEKNTCTIAPLIPGCEYLISFELPDGITVFNGTASYTVPKTTDFSGYEVSAADMTFQSCKTPADPDWDWKDIDEEHYTDTFTLSEKVSFVVRLHREYITSNDEIPTLFVVRDASGTPVSATYGRTRAWIDMWYKGYCELDMPVMPQTAGNYTVDIYFAGQYVTTQAFIVA